MLSDSQIEAKMDADLFWDYARYVLGGGVCVCVCMCVCSKAAGLPFKCTSDILQQNVVMEAAVAGM